MNNNHLNVEYQIHLIAGGTTSLLQLLICHGLSEAKRRDCRTTLFLYPSLITISNEGNLIVLLEELSPFQHKKRTFNDVIILTVPFITHSLGSQARRNYFNYSPTQINSSLASEVQIFKSIHILIGGEKESSA